MKLNVTYILTIFVRPQEVFIFVGSVNFVNSYWKAAVYFCNGFCSTLDNVHIFVSLFFFNFLVIMSTMVAIVKFENLLNFSIILCPLLFCHQMIQERFFRYLILSCIFYADIRI